MDVPSSPSGPGGHVGDVPFAAHAPQAGTPSRFPWPADVGGPQCDEPDVPHLGVLFVHGVGYQLSGEIFNSNSARLLRYLREAMYPDDPLRDPVRYGTRSVGWNQQPLIEVVLPVVGEDGTRSRVHWVLSEAYWASTFEPPDLGTVAEWLGPGQGAARAARRLRYPGGRTAPEPAEDAPAPPDSIGAFEALVSVGVALILGVYSLLRGLFAIIPITALRTALIGPIDRFLTQWAGDMRIMLFDESQASIIRDRVARAAKALGDFGCSRIAVIAHSGGVVSTYMTLTDPLYRPDLPVRRYVTYGQGLSVAWRLLNLATTSDQNVASRIGGRLADPLPTTIIWDNYWGTDDPVPAGPVDDPPPPARRATNIRVNNMWSTSEDHNGYFDNDEDFVRQVVGSLWAEVPGGDLSEAVGRATDTAPDALRAAAIGQQERRRSRVGVHSMWGHLVSAMTAIAILGALFTGLIGYWTGQRDGLTRPLEDITDAISAWWSEVPGASLLDEPAQYLQSLDFWWLSFIGYVFWTAVLVLAGFYLLRPSGRDWVAAAGGRSWQTLAAFAAVLVALAAQVIAFLFGIPGLIGVSIASTPWWKSEWPQEVLNHGIERFWQGTTDNGDFGSIAAGISRNLLLFAALIAFALAATAVVWLFRRYGPTQLRIIGLTLFAVGVITVIVGAIYAVLVSPGFGSNLLGWALIAILLSIVGKIGDWRWHQWDNQERWEARAALRGAVKRRRFGRWLDAVIFTVAGVGVIGIGTGIALRPLYLDLANLLILTGLAVAALAMLAGGAQDFVNQETPASGGSSPTEVPTAASRAL